MTTRNFPHCPFKSNLHSIKIEKCLEKKPQAKNSDRFFFLYNPRNKKNKMKLIGHFTVMDGSEVDGDLVLIQTFMLYYVNQVILMLTSSVQEQFP